MDDPLGRTRDRPPSARSIAAAPCSVAKIRSNALTTVWPLVWVPPWRYVATSRTTRPSSAELEAGIGPMEEEDRQDVVGQRVLAELARSGRCSISASRRSQAGRRQSRSNST